MMSMNEMGQNQARKGRSNLQALVMLFVLIGMFIVLSLLSPMFSRVGNVINIFKQTAINGILATGMACAILVGGFDMSVGSTVGLSGIIAALMATGGQEGLFLPVVCSVLAGLLVGVINGVAVAYMKVPAFVVTLGTQSIVRGLAYILSGGRPIFGVSESYEKIAGGLLFGKIPYLVIYYIVIALLMGFILQCTVYGRRMYAVGGNAEAARVSGINVEFIQMSAFAICGLMGGIAGMLSTSRTVSAAPLTGEGYELDAIASCVIGGFSMDGGAGKWYGMIIGALILSVMSNGLDILGVASYYQRILKGAIIIIIVLIDVRSKRKRT
jgi:ribose/xylose/arabinose/galactoside ABC-type transport system permease subunit